MAKAEGLRNNWNLTFEPCQNSLPLSPLLVPVHPTHLSLETRPIRVYKIKAAISP